ncbi:aldehyde dehydrogenase [Pedobacter lusitanus]|uniref:Contig120, whole genome shotgun sequence n=1 Tax=Pedobacter lusitanus TaxID=1503925 RepID=A0A0D0GKN9_9SPHI|nr:PA2169 family four-helix-bundle protein [Pedobacter lusitanus]KIO74991.1 aldehyde dehydrogenase [Pedobacter lusitanus]
MENTKVNPETLNDLIKINNDRITGYEKAIQELTDNDRDLKDLFLKMIAESHTNKMALASAVQGSGTELETGTTAAGKIYRAWMDVKGVFTGYDRKTILNNCEAGEDAAQKAYKMALEEEDLSAETRNLIEEQKVKLRASHDQIRALRDQTV